MSVWDAAGNMFSMLTVEQQRRTIPRVCTCVESNALTWDQLRVKRPLSMERYEIIREGNNGDWLSGVPACVSVQLILLN